MLNLSTVLNRRQYLQYLAGMAWVPAAAARVAPTRAQSLNGDLSILSAAAALELQAIAAYTAGAASGKLSPQVLSVAGSFLKEHEGHARAINAAIEALGGARIEPLKRYEFGALPDERSILALALELEQGAADAYTVLATNIQNQKVLSAAAAILVDETKHVTLIRLVLGLPVV